MESSPARKRERFSDTLGRILVSILLVPFPICLVYWFLWNAKNPNYGGTFSFEWMPVIFWLFVCPSMIVTAIPSIVGIRLAASRMREGPDWMIIGLSSALLLASALAIITSSP